MQKSGIDTHTCVIYCGVYNEIVVIVAGKDLIAVSLCMLVSKSMAHQTDQYRETNR